MTRPECIFCKSTTASFTSVEHIVPESLGNRQHVLPPGVVCDSCNNYFSLKVEQPILNSDWFCQARHRNGIRSKRGRIPEVKGLSFPHGTPISLGAISERERYITATYDRDATRLMNELHCSSQFAMVFSVPKPPERRLLARFLVAIGMKVTAHRMLPVPEGIRTDLTHNKCFDEARRFARYGEGPLQWPVHEKVIYDEQHEFNDADGSSYQISHEYMLLWTNCDELYFVIALFGTQYTINMGGPELEGFEKWLVEHDNQSPLYLTGIS